MRTHTANELSLDMQDDIYAIGDLAVAVRLIGEALGDREGRVVERLGAMILECVETLEAKRCEAREAAGQTGE